ncbi:MAG: hypothetical protein V4649_07105 [Bacteroidota bacterium]
MKAAYYKELDLKMKYAEGRILLTLKWLTVFQAKKIHNGLMTTVELKNEVNDKALARSTAA